MKASLWEKAPVLRLLLPFVIGIIAYDRIEVVANTHFPLWLLCCFLLFAGISVLSLTIKFRLLIPAALVLSQLVLFLLAINICQLQNDQLHPQWMGRQTDTAGLMLAVVSAEPAEKAKTIKYELNAIETFDQNLTNKVKGTALLYVYKTGFANNIHRGDTLLLPNKWLPITNSGNPFEIDYRKYSARKNIYVQQFLSGKDFIVYPGQRSSSMIETCHQYCLRSLEAYIHDSTALALMKAMLIGDESDIEKETRQIYSDTGIIHIVSISGAHVAMLFFAISFCFRWIKNRKYHWLITIVSLASIWFYVLLAGAATPAIRAAIMFTIAILGTVSRQQSNPLNQLLSAAFIMLLFNPLWLFQIGFQLSFIAVLSLIIFYQPLASIWKPSHKLSQFLNKTIAASIAAEILVAPLVAFYFHSFPPMFLVANIVASLLMGLILYLGMALLIFSKIGVMAKCIAALIVLCSQLFHYCINLLQLVDIPGLKVIYLSLFDVLLFYLFIIPLTFLLLLKKKKAIWPALSLLLICAINSLSRSWQVKNQEKLIVYNSKPFACELIRGETHQPLGEFSIENNAMQSTHIGYGANKGVPSTKKALGFVHNKKVIVLESTTHIRDPFPVDILVIHTMPTYSKPADLIKTFSPKQIVIADAQLLLKEWEVLCTQHKIVLHNIKTTGAYLFPANAVN